MAQVAKNWTRATSPAVSDHGSPRWSATVCGAAAASESGAAPDGVNEKGRATAGEWVTP